MTVIFFFSKILYKNVKVYLIVFLIVNQKEIYKIECFPFQKILAKRKLLKLI